MENRQGQGKNSVGNTEAKELICTTYGHELNVGECGAEGVCSAEGNKGGEWDNCNSIINKYTLKNCFYKKRRMFSLFL